MTLRAFLLFVVVAPSLDSVGKIFVFLAMLSILVVLHESGHFFTARASNVRVNDFAVGFGPTIAKWTSPRSGTNYRLNALPIGGYCAMQGEDEPNEVERTTDYVRPDGKTEDNFQSKNGWTRLGIIVAGPVANFFLAFAILYVGAVTFGTPAATVSTKVGPVLPNSPAARAGLAFGDQILSIDGKPYTDGEAMVSKIHASIGKPLLIDVREPGGIKSLTIVPEKAMLPGKGGKPEAIGRIGFSPVPDFKRVGILAGFPIAGYEFVNAITLQFDGYGQLIRNPKKAGGSMSGVIGMERAAASYQDLGWGPYLQLAAMISIALGIINLVPFPALDGGRAVFIVAEMVRGKPVPPDKEAFVHIAGFAVLMVLMVFVAYHDILNIVAGKGAL